MPNIETLSGQNRINADIILRQKSAAEALCAAQPETDTAEEKNGGARIFGIFKKIGILSSKLLHNTEEQAVSTLPSDLFLLTRRLGDYTGIQILNTDRDYADGSGSDDVFGGACETSFTVTLGGAPVVFTLREGKIFASFGGLEISLSESVSELKTRLEADIVSNPSYYGTETVLGVLNEYAPKKPGSADAAFTHTGRFLCAKAIKAALCINTEPVLNTVTDGYLYILADAAVHKAYTDGQELLSHVGILSLPDLDTGEKAELFTALTTAQAHPAPAASWMPQPVKLPYETADTYCLETDKRIVALLEPVLLKKSDGSADMQTINGKAAPKTFMADMNTVIGIRNRFTALYRDAENTQNTVFDAARLWIASCLFGDGAYTGAAPFIPAAIALPRHTQEAAVRILCASIAGNTDLFMRAVRPLLTEEAQKHVESAFDESVSKTLQHALTDGDPEDFGTRIERAAAVLKSAHMDFSAPADMFFTRLRAVEGIVGAMNALTERIIDAKRRACGTENEHMTHFDKALRLGIAKNRFDRELQDLHNMYDKGSLHIPFINLSLASEPGEADYALYAEHLFELLKDSPAVARMKQRVAEYKQTEEYKAYMQTEDHANYMKAVQNRMFNNLINLHPAQVRLDGLVAALLEEIRKELFGRVAESFARLEREDAFKPKPIDFSVLIAEMLKQAVYPAHRNAAARSY